MQDYKVQLDIYQGPLDLLLYLIRRDEVDIYDIPIARVTEQFVQYVELLRRIDPNIVGDFLVMAATLMEIKSRMLLPRPPAEEEDEEFVDPRLSLVRQLLEYKRFKDAARLAEAHEERMMRFERAPADRPDTGDPIDVELEDVQIWDLLTAFNNLMSSIGRTPMDHEVVYDDTPVSLHAADIQDRLEREGGSLRFEQIFEGRTKAEMIGLFLALLELIRQDRVRIEQEDIFAPIIVHLLDATPVTEASILRGGKEPLEPAEPAKPEDIVVGEDRAATAPQADEPPHLHLVGADDESDDEDDRDDEYARLIDGVDADRMIEVDRPRADPKESVEADQDEESL
jgi:segregation and condensation protein A